MNVFTLRNGVQLPQIGFGTWQITDRELMKALIAAAYAAGYRLIDTAAAYSNEIAIAKAIADLPRENLILSDKVWNTSRGCEAVQEACKRSLRKLKTDYFDMYLIHWPASIKSHEDWAEINADTWRGMEQLYRDGLVRVIGVCNFKIHHLEELKKTAEIMPYINQVEFHPGMAQKELLNYCKNQKIQLEASSPLGNGTILQNQLLMDIGKKYGKTSAQICLRWAVQQDIIVIPKTSQVFRLKNNLEIYDFELSLEEMNQIHEIPYCGGIGIDPDEGVEE